jgi:hypothetical protein
MPTATFTFKTGPASYQRYSNALPKAIDGDARTELLTTKSPVYVINVDAESPEAARKIAASLLDTADELIVKADDAKSGGAFSAIPAIHTETHAIDIEISG